MELMAKLRWYPGDPLREIREEDLKGIAQRYGVTISLEEVGKGLKGELTLEKPLEEISQIVVTVSASDEESFRQAVRHLIRMYRAPRTVYSLWGSQERGASIVRELADEDDGW